MNRCFSHRERLLEKKGVAGDWGYSIDEGNSCQSQIDYNLYFPYNRSSSLVSVDPMETTMHNAVMAKRPRILIDVKEDLRVAIRLAAAKADVTVGEMINRILSEALTEELEVARAYLAKGKKKKGEQ
jgi:hypothetical protein